MKLLFAGVLVVGYVAFVYLYPRYWGAALAVVATALALALLLAARRHIEQHGGVGLWWRWVRARLRPAVTRKAKERKASATLDVVNAIDKVHMARQREARKQQQLQVGHEVRKIGDALAQWRERYEGHSFVQLHFLDNGVGFTVTDDQPYAHQDLYAILAKIEDHRRWRRKVIYSVRKGQILEDKEVFPAHTSPPRFTSLRKASRVLRKELQKVIDEIAARN